jgi:hypothetical protein
MPGSTRVVATRASVVEPETAPNDISQTLRRFECHEMASTIVAVARIPSNRGCGRRRAPM